MSSLADSNDLLLSYDRMLGRWKAYARQGLQISRGGVSFFGDPSNGENGIRSAANFVFASAEQARRGDEELLDWARRGIRYLWKGHRGGEGACANGQQWGRAWQSSWWSAKFGLGAYLVWAHLDAVDRAGVSAVVADEADWLLKRMPPTGMIWDTKAEENAWDTEVLATALLLMPRHPHAAEWEQHLHRFGINSLSRAVDRESEVCVAGRPLREWVSSVNLFHDFTLENHGSCHFCYVASPLASLGWSRMAFLLAGQACPASLLHNVAPFWERHKSLFLDNRFAYIGGQDWARYTYGQYFIVPVCVALQQLNKDPDARVIEVERIRRLELEQRANGDGAFFSLRVTAGSYVGQRLKYETDCFAHLAMARLLREVEAPDVEAHTLGQLHARQSTMHLGLEGQVAWVRTPRSFSSFCVEALDTHKPLALFSPTGGDDLTEWMPGNLCGRLEFEGREGILRILSMSTEQDALVIDATLIHKQRGQLALEQSLKLRADLRSDSLQVKTSVVALRKMWIRECFGLNLAVANDLFNDFHRCYAVGTLPSRGTTVAACRRGPGLIERIGQRLNIATSWGRRKIPLESDQVVVDEILSVETPGMPLWILQSPYQNASESLHYDVLGAGPHRTNFWARSGETLFSFEARLGLAPPLVPSSRDASDDTIGDI